MQRGARITIGAGAVVVLLAGGVAWYLGPIAPVATGYAAKTTCSGVFVGGRDDAHVAQDVPPNPLVPLLRTTVDDRSVTTTLLGLWASTAYHADGLGCTLAEARPLDIDPQRFAAPDPPAAPDPQAPWPEGNAPVDPPDDVDAEHLDAAIAAAFTEDDPEGRRRNSRAVVVVKDGQLIAERYGEGFGPDTPLLGWSMSKSVTNALVGRLVHAGDLEVSDDRLRADWADERAGITIEHLLTMTSGLPFDEVYDPGTDATEMLFRPGSAAEVAAERPLEHDPGTVWSYSSGTSNILCDALQRDTGAGPQLVSELVFAPLGMTSAVMEPDSTGSLVCSTFTYATARDWARFGQWFLQDGVWEGDRLLPEGWVAASTEPVPLETEAPYGWHWWLNQGPNGELRMPSVPADAYWASGHEGQQVVVVPSEQLVVVRLGFSGAFRGVEWGLEPLLAGTVEATS